ncbi:MAG: ATP-binding protein [Elainellaceae cyanobacterium]
MAGKKILVVEDERVVARDIEKRLKKLGYAIAASVSTGQDAIAAAADQHPDLILMDIRLKGDMDGVEAAEHIRSQQDIPVIYLTAYADETTLQRAKITEPFGYIIKPFDEKDLHVAIEVALRRRLAELAVQVALEKEKELSELKSRFWSMVAHEFRNPMSVILSYAQILETHGHELPESQKQEYLRTIQRDIRAMDRLLTDVLAISRVEGDHLSFNPEVIDLTQFCQDLVQEMEFSWGRGHQIIFTAQNECARSCFDANLIWHILSNLLSNAIKYSPDESTIYFNLTYHDRVAIIQVKDSGIGIPLETQETMFEPFHRADNVGDIAGTGLGLTMVKKCLDLHGGTISVSSQPGAGTTFTVSIPASDRCNLVNSRLKNRPS